MRRFATIAGLYLAVLAVTWFAVTRGAAPPQQAEGPSDAPPPAPEDIELAAALVPFDGCDDLLAYFKREGLERVGPYGLEGGFPGPVAVDALERDAASATVGGSG